jgi:hypothetical protein
VAGLRREGIAVLLLEPAQRDLEVMGLNFMSRKRRHDVIRTAIDTIGHQLHRPQAKELLRGLPPAPAAKIRRPEGEPKTWDTGVLRAT